MLNPSQIHQLVTNCEQAYHDIQHREWNEAKGRYGMSEHSMWTEAANATAPKGWEEIIRVLAQGGDYYSIAWAA